MKIILYLYKHELTFSGKWDLPYFPNVGDTINIYSFLTEEDRDSIKDVMYGDVASDVELSKYQRNHEDINLWRVLERYPCEITKKTWTKENDEWVCTFVLNP
ncbi:hypothetical protein [Phocaeicola vulgatus]|uniref:hypothetical protein n=1 Tax=Phocaeicola vulgatus TaxID=821 RepID=UPI00202FB3CF|nr:hypothetical protein [Phocaeicola vulgatus]MCM1612103.1 hypothetical protein [Phocaeicola vulgatus]MCM1676459.1 hypothetical protein [Phocaeicola vulgatus]MCM1680608.1 hypothetical protein [Phocaeicola vulgatus]MCM1804121.1 hypothetical protein [Phocaeicola vulgatus]MCM1838022.1 hypothetical protein [Phocaeicola vulgatus]